jgi:hypothetical protein
MLLLCRLWLCCGLNVTLHMLLLLLVVLLLGLVNIPCLCEILRGS